jgi:predicted transcriptional regulator
VSHEVREHWSARVAGSAKNPRSHYPTIDDDCDGRSYLLYAEEKVERMEVHFTPEQEAQLAEVAASKGTDPEALVRDATMRLLQEDANFRAAVREGVAQADRGEFIEEEEMDARFEQMLRS